MRGGLVGFWVVGGEGDRADVGLLVVGGFGRFGRCFCRLGISFANSDASHVHLVTSL